MQTSPIDVAHSRLTGRTPGAPPYHHRQQLHSNDGSPVPNPPLLAVRTIPHHEQDDDLPRPRDSTESAASTTSSFVAISATSPSAPNGGRSVASNLIATQSSGGSNGVGGSSGKFSFLRNARKTPPPSARPTPPPHGGPPSSAIMMMGYPYRKTAPKRRPSAGTTNTSSSGGSSNKMPKLSRPRTASGIVSVPSKSAAPTAISGDQPIDITRITTSVSAANASADCNGPTCEIGIRPRRLSSSPPPPARPSPSAIMMSSNDYYSNPPPPYSLSRSPPTSGIRRPPPIPASFDANSNSARLASAQSPKLNVEHDMMQSWGEELDRIAIYRKHRSGMPSPPSSSPAATVAATNRH